MRTGAQKLGLETGSEPFFDTVRIKSGSSKDLVQRALDQGVNLRRLDDETVTVSFDEVTTIADVDQLFAILNGGSKPDFSAASLASEVCPRPLQPMAAAACVSSRLCICWVAGNSPRQPTPASPQRGLRLAMLQAYWQPGTAGRRCMTA